jgi:hypothetical protein
LDEGGQTAGAQRHERGGTLPAGALRPQTRIVADAVDRAENGIASAEKPVEAARLLGEAAIVVKEFAAEAFDQCA